MLSGLGAHRAGQRPTICLAASNTTENQSSTHVTATCLHPGEFRVDSTETTMYWV